MVGWSAAFAAAPKPTPVPLIFLNDEPLAPPDRPPQVDAVIFENRSLFVASNDFLFLPFFPTPYEAHSVLFWTNSGNMIGLPGFRFNYTPNPAHLTAAQRKKPGALLPKPSLAFDNSGEITVSSSLDINANHLRNPGILSGDANARMKLLSPGLIDLSRGALRVGDLPQPDCTSVSNLFFGPFFFFTDPTVNYLYLDSGTSGFVNTNRTRLFLPSLVGGTNIFGTTNLFGPNFSPPNPLVPSFQYRQSVALFPGYPATNRITNVQGLLTSCGSYDAFVNVRTNAGTTITNIFGTNIFSFGATRDISVVFVPTNGLSTNVSVAVSFPTNPFTFFFFGDAPIVEFRSTDFDVITQRPTTNYVTFRDDGQNIFRAHDCDFDLGDPPNTPFTGDLFYNTGFTTNSVDYSYTVSSVRVGNTNSLYFTNDPLTQFFFFPPLGRSPAASDPTNAPGRLEIIAKDLDLTQARLRAENGIFIRATNLVGNQDAFIDAPFVSFDAGTTNRNLVISNFLRPQVSRLRAEFNSWAGSWSVGVSNGFTTIPIIGTNGMLTNIVFPIIETWNYHVLVLGACVNDSTPSIVHRFSLRGNDFVIQDNLAINAALQLEGQSLTIGSNGSLTLPARANLAFTNLIGIVNFTNNGVVNVPGGAFFGVFEDGYVQPPEKKKKKKKAPPSPRLITYRNAVNHGTITGASVKIRANHVENIGTMFSPATVIGSNGPVSLDGATLTLSNAFIRASSDIRLTAGDLLVTRSTLLAGSTNSGSFGNFLPGALILDATNSLNDGGLGASNEWRVTGGVRMLRRPAPLAEEDPVGDLMGTRIESLASTFVQSLFTWAGEDRGVSVAGFSNNLALGRLVLDGRLGNQFRFGSATANNALYVDFLELRNAATNYNFALGVDPGFTIYFADSNVSPEKLNNLGGGRILWVSDFAGPQSATNILYPNGVTYTFNAGLVRSFNLDSDGDLIPNDSDCTPIIPPGEEANTNLWFGANCPPVPLTASVAKSIPVAAPVVAISLAPEGREVILNWDAPANSANSVEFTESLGGVWQPLTNFINGPVDARVTLRDAATASLRVYRVRVDAGKP
jgi:hypothetical protein